MTTTRDPTKRLVLKTGTENRKKAVEVELKEHRIALLSDLDKQKEGHQAELRKQEVAV